MKTCCIEIFSKKFTKESNKLLSEESFANDIYLSKVNIARQCGAYHDFTEILRRVFLPDT